MGERMARHSLLLVLLAFGCASPQAPGPDSPDETFRRIREGVEGASTVLFDYRIVDRGSQDDPMVHEFCSAAIASGNRVSMTFRAPENGEVRYRFRSDGKHMSTYPAGATVCDRIDVPDDLVKFIVTCLFRGTFPYDDRMIVRADLMERVKAAQRSASLAGMRSEGTARGLASLSYDVHRGDSGGTATRVRLWYDSKDCRLRKLQTLHQWRGMSVVLTLDNIELNGEVPATAFELPPENPLPKQTAAVKAALAKLDVAIEAYAIDNNGYPTTAQGLSALLQEPEPKPRKWKGPYVTDAALLTDPWGNAYTYRSPRAGINPQGYDLTSCGPDGKAGTRDDIGR
jgi:type II secretion system protein G